MKYKTVALDFDGTVVYGAPWPTIGELRPYCKEVLDLLVARGWEFVLNTTRTGEFLEAALEFIKEQQLPIVYKGSNKPLAPIIIDDRSLFCTKIDWPQIGSKLLHIENDTDFHIANRYKSNEISSITMKENFSHFLQADKLRPVESSASDKTNN